MASPYDLIVKKRNGAELDPGEIRAFIEGFVSGEIPAYQVSALLMAIYFRGMTRPEIVALTEAMIASGDVIDPDRLGPVTADKHSTGGVGDKISLILAPAVAACGVPVPMMSGRGLGHTGGTLDKLESIPGLRTDLSAAEMENVLRRTGLAMAGQTARLVPADRQLYALRDVTGTIESIPLIASSIMSKKIAAGPRILVLDVKTGRGAFMSRIEDARQLARTMVEIGTACGRRVAAMITDMSQPLGCEVGNVLEVQESILTLRGQGPADLVELTCRLGGLMLQLAGAAADRAGGESAIARSLQDGTALARFRAMVEAQGGDPAYVDAPDRLPAARRRTEVRSIRAGVVQAVDALEIGLISVALGAGRRTMESTIDPAVGISLAAKVGQPVAAGGRLATLHHSGALAAGLLARAQAAFKVGDGPAATPPLVRETVAGESEGA